MPSGTAARSRTVPRERAQSSVMGVVLVVAITVIGVTGVLVFGSSALTDARGDSEVDAAAHAMTQLDSRVSLVALGSSSRQRATVPLQGTGDGLVVDERSGWMNVSIENGGVGSAEIMNVTLGEITYTNGGSTIAYQGGGVWRRDGSGASTMVSPPEFHYRAVKGEDPTVTLPLVTVTGSGSVGGEVAVTRRSTVGKFPHPTDAALQNPLTGGRINVTVGSTYYRAWGEFFESRSGGSVVYHHGREAVTVSLVVPSTQQPIEGGIVSGVSGGTLQLESNFELDSYNSSDGAYAPSSDGVIVTAGSVQMASNSRILGTLKTAGTVTMDSNAEITGDLYYGSPPTIKGNAEVLGDEYNDPPAVDISPVGGLIDTKLADIRSNNDSGGVAAISDNQLQGCGDPDGCELPAGDYFLEEIGLQGDEELVLNNSEGPITIAVEGRVDLDTNRGIEVTDPDGGTVRIYVGSDDTDAVELDSNSAVTVPEDRAPLLWLYGRPGAGVQFDSNSVFVGVVYAPGTKSKPGSISCDSNGEVYGGLVGNVDQIDSNCEVHFDEALTVESAIVDGSPWLARITYLHISVVEVEVTDG